jgi:hypothetical protein
MKILREAVPYLPTVVVIEAAVLLLPPWYIVAESLAQDDQALPPRSVVQGFTVC